MNYTENLSNVTIFIVNGKRFADDNVNTVKEARENECNPIEWIQDELENTDEDFKVTDKEAFAYKVKEIINYFTNEEITKEDIEEFLK
jgi:hypothetical protein